MNTILKINLLILALPFCINATELKEKKETPSALVTRINEHRDACLREHLIPNLARLVQEYDPIQDKWECERTLEGHTYGVISVCLLPGNKLASASQDNTIKIWDLNSGKCEQTLEDHKVRSVCALPDNKLASVSWGETTKIIKIWNLTSGKCEQTLTGHEDSVNSVCALPGNKLASASADKTIRIWDLTLNKCTTVLESDTQVDSVCSVSLGNKLAYTTQDGKIRIWDLNSNKCIIALRTGRVESMCVLPGNKLASSAGRIIIIWNLTLSDEAPAKSDSGKCEVALQSDAILILKICSLPGNKLASSYRTSGIIEIWDLNKRQVTTSLEGHKGQPTSLCASPENKLISASFDKTIKIWSNPVITSGPTDEEFLKFMHEKESWVTQK